MHVLYWTHQYWPSIGGVEVLATRFIHAMRQRGYEFTVVTSHGNHPLPDEDVHEGVSIHRFPFLRAIEARDMDALVRATQAVAALKRRLRPDVVHIQLTDPSALFHLRTAHAYRAPTLVSVHVAPPRQMASQSLLGDLMRSAVWITANSQAVAADIAALVPLSAARTAVIHPAVDLPSLPPAPLPFTPPILLCLGRVVSDKGFDLAIDSLPGIRAVHRDTRLVIAGDGAARGELEQQARRLGVGDAVTFAGWVAPDDVPGLINRATIVLVPSRWREAFGIVALQAAQMGRPVVCTDAGGLREIVAHERTGLVVPIDDRDAFAAAVIQLLRDPSRTRQLGTQARAHAVRHFSWSRQLDAYAELYDRLARDGDPRSA